MARRTQLKVEIVTTEFNRMLRDLAAIDPRASFEKVIHAEAAAVLRTALSRTKAAKVASIRRDVEGKEFTTFNGKRYRLANRYPNAVWSRLAAFRKQSLQTKLASRGLSKASWFYASKLLSETQIVPAYVRNANYKGRHYPENASKRETGTGTAYTLTITNSSPIVQLAGGQRALLSAMRGRVRYFERNLQAQAFRTLATRARAYPGIFATPSA